MKTILISIQSMIQQSLFIHLTETQMIEKFRFRQKSEIKSIIENQIRNEQIMKKNEEKIRKHKEYEEELNRNMLMKKEQNETKRAQKEERRLNELERQQQEKERKNKEKEMKEWLKYSMKKIIKQKMEKKSIH